MTDDQTFDQMGVMTATRHLIGSRGVTFENAFASYPLCCPSRSTFLTGQYAHNTGVQGNRPFGDGGGYVALREPKRILPAWLYAAGYETVHLGKWANSPGPSVPPGWDWWGRTFNHTTNYYDFSIREADGSETHYGADAADYQTDLLTQRALDWLAERDNHDPFLLSIAYLAPHAGQGRDDAAGRRCEGVDQKGFAQPPPRYAGRYVEGGVPQTPSYNEPDISDKPAAVAPPLLSAPTLEKADRSYTCSLATLLAVDDSVKRLVAALRRSGELANTVVLFTSDQGKFYGEHRQGGGKNLPYDEATRIPLLIRGPGIRPGQLVGDPVVNADIAPTLLDLLGVDPKPSLARPRDGRSLLPQIVGRRDDPNRLVLIEGKQKFIELDSGDGYESSSYQGVRSVDYLYVEYRSALFDRAREASDAPFGAGEVAGTELYDLRSDPFQIENRSDDPAYAPTRRALADALAKLRDCVGEDCLLSARIPRP